jgi:hypothetical protein
MGEFELISFGLEYGAMASCSECGKGFSVSRKNREFLDCLNSYEHLTRDSDPFNY